MPYSPEGNPRRIPSLHSTREGLQGFEPAAADGANPSPKRAYEDSITFSLTDSAYAVTRYQNWQDNAWNEKTWKEVI
jgi:hypothetical protein